MLFAVVGHGQGEAEASLGRARPPLLAAKACLGSLESCGGCALQSGMQNAGISKPNHKKVDA